MSGVVSENCLPLSHVVAHSFLIQGDTKYSIKKNSFVIGIGNCNFIAIAVFLVILHLSLRKSTYDLESGVILIYKLSRCCKPLCNSSFV